MQCVERLIFLMIGIFNLTMGRSLPGEVAVSDLYMDRRGNSLISGSWKARSQVLCGGQRLPA
jgi:hypothetical protein